MMKSTKISLFLELGVVALFVSMLSGCFGDGSNPTYDGTWRAAVADANPVTISGVTATCALSGAVPTLTLANGMGSFQQINTCSFLSASAVLVTQDYLYLVSVAVTNSNGAVNAIINGSTISGQCISAIGCAAQGSGYSLSLTR